MSQCSACRAENREAATFCRNCGRRLGLTLPPDPPKPPPDRGTVIKDSGGGGRRTILYGERDQLPVQGWLFILKGRRKGKDFRIEKESSVLGRDGSCDYIIEDDSVSNHHVRFRIEAGKFMLYDLGSSNGTFVNGHKDQKFHLQDGDLIKVGESVILFKEAKARASISSVDGPAI